MYQLIKLNANTTSLAVRNSISPAAAGRGLLLIPLVLACFGLLPMARAVSPAPDGGYGGYNTAEGQNTLFNLTTGIWNTALGAYALFSNTTGSGNTAVGTNALRLDTIGFQNTANGVYALYSNIGGNQNTAEGYQALFRNAYGYQNTATGYQTLFNNVAFNNVADGFQALFSNTTGDTNTANGYRALYSNTTGLANTAGGGSALYHNIDGSDNTAYGTGALSNNTTASGNTAIGGGALSKNTSGSNNIAIGVQAGFNLSTGSYNIDIGDRGTDTFGESNTIRIGEQGFQARTFIAGISGVAVAGTTVVVNGNGQLGVAASSKRFKEDIRPIDKASEAILSLKPVSFRYKKEIDPAGTPQFGLVAEDIEKVNPALVVLDQEGKPYTVRYDAVNAMLLNEFLKEHRKVEQQDGKMQEQETTIAQLKREMETVVVRLKEQDSKLQKVSDRLEVSKPAPRMVSSNQ